LTKITASLPSKSTGSSPSNQVTLGLKEIKKAEKKNSSENAYTLSRKRFSPVVVFNSANVSSSFTQQTNKQRVKIKINKNAQTQDQRDIAPQIPI